MTQYASRAGSVQKYPSPDDTLELGTLLLYVIQLVWSWKEKCKSVLSNWFLDLGYYR